MTVEEALVLYGTRQYTTSPGDNLKSIARRIYESDGDIYPFILKTLNIRFDWDNVKPNSVILYLPKEICSEIYEVTG